VSRRTVAVLVVGWLLGLLTAFLLPAVSTERQSYVPPEPTLAAAYVRLLTLRGWVVTRTDTAGGVTIYQMERPRYLAVADQLRAWWSDLTESLGVAPPRTPTPVLTVGPSPSSTIESAAAPVVSTATSQSPPDLAAAPTTASESRTATPVPTFPSPPPSQRFHVVEGGDTINRISQRYGVTVERLMEANGITDRNRILRIGERLVIPETPPGSPLPRQG